MNLTLTIVKGPADGEMSARSFDSAVVAGRGASLGRQPDNDWVLPGDLSVSRHHCRIMYEQGAFAILDTSSFGSEVNGQRLARGQRVALANGDRINLSSYEFSVSIDDASGTFAGAPDFASITRDPMAPDFSSRMENATARDLGQSPDFVPAQSRPVLDEFKFDPASGSDPFLAPSNPHSGERVSPFGRTAAQPILDEFEFNSIGQADPVLTPRGQDSGEPTTPDYLAAEKEAFPFPKVRKLLPDDASIFGDLLPAGEPIKQSEPAQDGFSEFLRGAGLPKAPDSGNSTAKLRVAGETYRAALEGIRAILLAREQFKTEFRIEKTVFGAEQNNPLKPRLPVSDALSVMIRGRQGFMPAPQAMREALEDIKAHELALIAGIQVALTHLLGQLDPERLERRLEKRSVLDGLPGLRKARLWEVYETMHAEIARELEEDFQGSFGRAFAEAYGKYVRGK